MLLTSQFWIIFRNRHPYPFLHGQQAQPFRVIVRNSCNTKLQPRSLPAKPCPILIYTDEDESELYGESWEELQRLGADDILMKGMNAGEMLLRKTSGLLGLPWDEDE